MGLGAQVHGEDPGEQVGVVLPAAGDLRGQRRRGPGVHDVGVADEPARLAALVLACSPSGTSVDGSTGRRSSAARIGASWSTAPVVVDRVPDREGDAEEALAADVPVARSAPPPRPRSGGACTPGASRSSSPRSSSRSRSGERPHVPLAGRDDLEGPLALLVELDRVGDRPGLADEGPGARPAARRSAVLGLPDRPAGRARRRRRPPSPGSSDSQPGSPQATGSRRPSRPTMVRVGRRELAPPVTSVVSPKVQIMAMPEPLSGSASSWARTGTRTPNSGVTHLGAEQRPGSGRRRGGRRGPRRRRAARAGWSRSRPPPVAADPGEAQPVVGARALPVLELGLGHRRLEVDVPQRGRVRW